jgi:hypothetical protein
MAFLPTLNPTLNELREPDWLLDLPRAPEIKRELSAEIVINPLNPQPNAEMANSDHDLESNSLPSTARGSLDPDWIHESPGPWYQDYLDMAAQADLELVGEVTAFIEAEAEASPVTPNNPIRRIRNAKALDMSRDD